MEVQSKNNNHLLEFLYIMIAVSFIIWTIAFVQIRNIMNKENIGIISENNTELNFAERVGIINSINNETSKVPILSNKQRSVISEGLNKQSQESLLTKEQRTKILNDIKNKI